MRSLAASPRVPWPWGDDRGGTRLAPPNPSGLRATYLEAAAAGAAAAATCPPAPAPARVARGLAQPSLLGAGPRAGTRPRRHGNRGRAARACALELRAERSLPAPPTPQRSIPRQACPAMGMDGGRVRGQRPGRSGTPSIPQDESHPAHSGPRFPAKSENFTRPRNPERSPEWLALAIHPMDFFRSTGAP